MNHFFIGFFRLQTALDKYSPIDPGTIGVIPPSPEEPTVSPDPILPE